MQYYSSFLPFTSAAYQIGMGSGRILGWTFRARHGTPLASSTSTPFQLVRPTHMTAKIIALFVVYSRSAGLAWMGLDMALGQADEGYDLPHASEGLLTLPSYVGYLPLLQVTLRTQPTHRCKPVRRAVLSWSRLERVEVVRECLSLYCQPLSLQAADAHPGDYHWLIPQFTPLEIPTFALAGLTLSATFIYLSAPQPSPTTPN